MPGKHEGVWGKCWSGGPPAREGAGFLGRLVVTCKHAYWQFLPDELISPFILPEQPDNLPSVKFRQKRPLPCPDLAGPACQPTAAGRPAGLAFGSGASTLSRHCSYASPLGLREDQQQEPSSLWKSLGLGTGPWPLVPCKHARIKNPRILRP